MCVWWQLQRPTGGWGSMPQSSALGCATPCGGDDQLHSPEPGSSWPGRACDGLALVECGMVRRNGHVPFGARSNPPRVVGRWGILPQPPVLFADSMEAKHVRHPRDKNTQLPHIASRNRDDPFRVLRLSLARCQRSPSISSDRRGTSSWQSVVRRRNCLGQL
jgi:hypothetical protein